MIPHILRKDWRLLWPLVVLLTAIQVALEWAVYKSGFFGESADAGALLRPLTLALLSGMAALVVALVQEDPVPGVEQDWLIRPIRRRDMLLAKALFALLAICVPMLIVNFVHAQIMGFSAAVSLAALSWKALYAFLCLIVPLLALASMTRNMGELAVMGAALMVVYALSLGLAAMALGPDHCPTCDSGVSWLQHFAAHIGVLVASVVILWLQYRHRRTELSRKLALAGAAALVFVQMPWSTAFSLQQWLDGSARVVTPVAVQIAKEGVTVSTGKARHAPGTRGATSALLRGDVDEAANYLQQRVGARQAAVIVDVPLQIRGVASDELLLFDRSEADFTDGRGRSLYHGAHVAEWLGPVVPAVEGSDGTPAVVHQKLSVPSGAFPRSTQGGLRLELKYSVTLMHSIAQYPLAALSGVVRTKEAGICATQADRDGIRLRCKKLTLAPFCYSATVYAADGTHNPEVFNCGPDYRPYLPAMTNALSFFGLSIPTRDPAGQVSYTVGAAELEQAHVVLKVYAVRTHFTQALAAEIPQSLR